MASFEVLLKLGELRELVYHLHYDNDTVGEDAARTGWVMVFTIRDLTQILENPLPATAEALRGTWGTHWQDLGSDVDSKEAIETEINRMRDITLNMLNKLD
jgi:hypothetical protein